MGSCARTPGPAIEQPGDERQRRRVAQVVGVGFERQAQHGDAAAPQAAQLALEPHDGALDLAAVHQLHGVEQRRRIVALDRQLLERAHVLGEARTAVADPGPEELRPDPPIVADPVTDRAHVDVEQLADVGDLVDERDLGRQEGVRRVLDHLRRARVGDHDRRVERCVEVAQHVLGLRVSGPDHDPVGLEEVRHRRPLAQELRVAHDADRMVAARARG